MKTIVQLVQNLLKPYIDGRDRATQANIAPVETDATSASKVYAQGTQLILNDVLYDVIASIAQGDALTVGTNIAAADDITTQIKNHTVTTDAVPTKNSTNPVQSGGVYTSEKTTREIIAPVEEDATSASTGYALGKQLILGGVLYDVIATITAGDALTVGTNIAVADSITDRIGKNEIAFNDYVNVYGAKNFVHITAQSQTIEGIEWTVNDDGTVTANGTATALSVLDIETTLTGLPAKDGDYILSDALATHDGNSYTTLTVVDSSDVVHYDYADTKTADNDEFTIVSSNVKSMYLALVIASGVTVDNLVFKPMVRMASIKDDTFEPFSMSNKDMTPLVQTLSHTNLLDNPWFSVNQRGQNSYTTNGYTVDRWKCYASGGVSYTVDIDNDGCIDIDNTTQTTIAFYQKIENKLSADLTGKIVTFSVLFKDGTLYKKSGVFNGLYIKYLETDDFIMIYSASDKAFEILTKSGAHIVIRALKVELGEASTLAMDVTPNYEEELLKCQRYFSRERIVATGVLGIAHAKTADYCIIMIPNPSMRALPTVTASGQLMVGNISVSDVSMYSQTATMLFLRLRNTGAFTAGSFYMVSADALTTVDFSADL